MKIGIVAPSLGIYDTEGLEKTKSGIKRFESLGFEVIVGNIMNNNKVTSSDKISRANDFMKIYKQSDIIISISGGELMVEILDYLDFDYIKNNPKIFMGYSDNTNLTFLLTTMLNMNTVYGYNFKTFGKKWDRSILNFYELLFKGKNIFKGFEMVKEEETENYLDEFKFIEPNKWKSINSNKMEGILLGGCLEVILNLIGTKYDYVKDYVLNKDIIWYFDIYDLNIFELKRALIQMNMAGYFKTTKGICISRFFTSNDLFNVTLKEILEEFSNENNIPIFYDVDLGHMPPVLPFVNGLNAKISINDGIGEIIYDKGKVEALTR